MEDDRLSLYELRCLWCAGTYFVCRRDFRGQWYCSQACRVASQAANHRQASARYERSLGAEGRQDRRDLQRMRRIRKRAEIGAVHDEGREEVALEAKCSLSGIATP